MGLFGVLIMLMEFGHLFKVCILCARDMYVPVKTGGHSVLPKWFNSDTRHLLKRVRSLRRRALKSSSTSKLQKLSQLESKLQVAIQDSRATFERMLVNNFSSHPKKLYQHLSSLSRPRRSNHTIIYNSSPVTDPAAKATLFNTFFNSTFTRSNFVLPDVLPAPADQLSDISIGSTDVFEALCALDSTKAPGPDGLVPSILKACASSLCQPIAHLFNQSLSTASFPTEWKLHKICPIPKKGDLSNHTNFHPISLLCVMSKVFERIVYEKIISFIRPKLSPHQFGFLKNRSCLTQLLSYFSIIFDAVDCGKVCDVVYLDLRKAFDSVPHNELLLKLHAIGITGSLWNWFQSYLCNRRHFVSVDGASSDQLDVLSGVPQGSVLGSLLFLIYVNDLPAIFRVATPFMFADDTKLLRVVSELSDCVELQSDLDALIAWCSEWKLQLNATKSSTMRFSSARKEVGHFTYCIDDCVLASDCSFRDLGIATCGNLSWSTHCNKVCASAYQSLHLLRRSIFSSNPNLKKRLYVTLVRCHFAYCSQLWRPRLIRDIKRVENVQRRATRFIVGSHLSGYKERLLRVGLLPLASWLELNDVMFIIRCFKSPSDNFNIRDFVAFSTGCRSSSAGHLQHKPSRISDTRHFYMTRISRLWNALSPIDLTLSIPAFRSLLYQRLWDNFSENFYDSRSCTFHFCCPCPDCILIQR